MTNIELTKMMFFILTTNCMYQSEFDSMYCNVVTIIFLQIISKWTKFWNYFVEDIIDLIEITIQTCSLTCLNSSKIIAKVVQFASEIRHQNINHVKNFNFFLYRNIKFYFTINFVTNLSTSQNWSDAKYDNILVVINLLTKINHYILITKTIKIKNLTNVFIKKIIRYHNFSNFIIIDRDSLFTFEYYSSLCYALKIKKKTLTTFHFQIDEQTKR